MKKVLFLAAVLFSMCSISSCSKCYTCKNLSAGTTVADACSSDLTFDISKSACEGFGGAWTQK